MRFIKYLLWDWRAYKAALGDSAKVRVWLTDLLVDHARYQWGRFRCLLLGHRMTFKFNSKVVRGGDLLRYFSCDHCGRYEYRDR